MTSRRFMQNPERSMLKHSTVIGGIQSRRGKIVQ
jgi:hypothetical protein